MASASTIKQIGDFRIDTDINKALGQTYNCVVFRGEHPTTEQNVAAKMFTWLKGFSTEMVDTEAEVMKRLPDHENVLKILDYIKKDTGENMQFWFILEYCSQGHLGQFVQRHSLSLAQKVDLMLQCSKGLQHIHQHKMVHRDIKLQNILVDGSPENPQVKLADFGILRIAEHVHEHSKTAMTPIGTPKYKAPELFANVQKASANKSVDTFSLGVSFLTLLDLQEGSDIPPLTGELTK